MPRIFSDLKYTFRIMILTMLTIMIPSVGFSESLEDDIIMRENGTIFLKDGSCMECKSFWWLVSAADFVQCDKGDHAVDVKLEDIDFEKTFGPDLAREYSASKEELAATHEKSRRERKTDVVATKSPMESETVQGPAPQESYQGTKDELPQTQGTEEVWRIRPGEGVGWIKLGMPYEKIVESLGKTVMESALPPDGKHQRYGIQGLEFYYKNDHITSIRIGTSNDKEYSRNKYKYSGLGVGSGIDEVTKVMGRPDYITKSEYTTVHSYVYKSGIKFSKYKTRDEVYTITIFSRHDYSRHARD